ncbi:MAG: Ezrin/radixin/moesin family protein [Cyclobacteriaceae bacterium]|nr:Ezrin/radixin/moesin family protein [Cyclobacteriaceae bacterium]
MKNLVLILVIIFCVSAVDVATAQLTKKEKKEWKKKLKKTSPEQFKRMYDENASLKSEVSSIQGQLSSLQAGMGEKDAKIAELTEQNRKMEAQVNAAKKAIAKAKQEAVAQPSTTMVAVNEDGILFKVQIGAFRNKDLSKYFDNNENFGGETEADGVQKITLGKFRDYWEADTFKKYLREMGVNDAWIVPYKDGTRVAMKDVLEGVIQ